MNRLCGSSMDAVATAARAIKSGEVDLIIAGGVESMSRAPFVMGKADAAFSRNVKLEDTTIGWRFINPAMKAKYGVDSMPETGEIVAEEYHISRADQDAFALRSQLRAADAIRDGRLAEEIVPVMIPQKKGEAIPFLQDEHPRADSTIEALAKLKGVVKPEGTVTAGNASGVNDGACALLIASEEAVARHGLTPKARVVASAAAGVAPAMLTFVTPPLTLRISLLHREPYILDHWLPQLPLTADELRRFRWRCWPRIHAKRFELVLDFRLLEDALQILADFA